MIAKGKYIKGGAANQKAAGSQLKAHFKYLEHRSRDELESREDRSLFSKYDDYVGRQEAAQDVMKHTSRSVSYHKILLSPGEDEPVQDWKQWTRDVMADLEDAQGKELHWYAVHHSNTDHEHVHVVVAGAGEDHESGREKAVKLYLDDYQQLRESGREYSDHDFYHQISEYLKELDQYDDIVREPVHHDLVAHDLEQHVPSHPFDLERGDHDR
jgi:type IV secretory pathway VirD2 relaxase